LSDENFKKNKFKILFVGPIAKGTTCNIERFKGYENFEHLGAMDLDALNLDEVLAGIIPYRENDPTINAITLSNKALQILTRGIPILVSGMPNFIQAPFIFNLVKDDFVGCLQKISGEFSSLQPFIEEFVGRNSAQSRLDQFLQD
ncbi:MAG: hypothetical protein OEV64_03940, partial [Desulfobulbaceae bacterium]|nr:hypothetical protein [Desulfobulbaceae bacterium]